MIKKARFALHGFYDIDKEENNSFSYKYDEVIEEKRIVVSRKINENEKNPRKKQIQKKKTKKSSKRSKSSSTKAQCKNVIDRIRKENFGFGMKIDDTTRLLVEKQRAQVARALERLTTGLYTEAAHCIFELIQNADDNKYDQTFSLPTLRFELISENYNTQTQTESRSITNDKDQVQNLKHYLLVMNNEEGFEPDNLEALCDIGQSTKLIGDNERIGQKGIGWKSVFRVSNAPEIHSNGFRVRWNNNNTDNANGIHCLLPHWIENGDSIVDDKQFETLQSSDWITKMVLPLIDENSLIQLSRKLKMLPSSIMLFLRRLQKIEIFQFDSNQSRNIERRISSLTDNIIEIHEEESGETKCTKWMITNTKLKTPSIHFGKQSNGRRKPTTELSIALPLLESSENTFEKKQDVFAFLPVCTYGLHFVLHADWDLTTSREALDEDSAWNQWLRECVPVLFIQAFHKHRTFVKMHPELKENLREQCKYLSAAPLINTPGEPFGFFQSIAIETNHLLRNDTCLPCENFEKHLVRGKKSNVIWEKPSLVLYEPDGKVKELISPNDLYHYCGLRYLQRNSGIPKSVLHALGVRHFSIFQLCTMLKEITNSKILEQRGVDWIVQIYLLIHDLLEKSSTALKKSAIQILQKLPLLPLTSGEWKSIENIPKNETIFLPLLVSSTEIARPGVEAASSPRSPSLHNAHKQVKSSSLNASKLKLREEAVEAFSHFAPELNVVHAEILGNRDVRGREAQILLRILQLLGARPLSAREVAVHHILPALIEMNKTRKVKNRKNLIAYTIFVKSLLDITKKVPNRSIHNLHDNEEKKLRKTLQFNLPLLSTLSNSVIYRSTKSGVLETPLYYSSHYENQLLVRRKFDDEIEFHEISEKYMKFSMIRETPELIASWRKFFDWLGVRDSLMNRPINIAANEVKRIITVANAKKSVEERRRVIQILLEIVDENWESGKKMNEKKAILSILQKQKLPSTRQQDVVSKNLFAQCDSVLSILGLRGGEYLNIKIGENFGKMLGLQYADDVTVTDAINAIRLYRDVEDKRIEQFCALYLFIAKKNKKDASFVKHYFQKQNLLAVIENSSRKIKMENVANIAMKHHDVIESHTEYIEFLPTIIGTLYDSILKNDEDRNALFSFFTEILEISQVPRLNHYLNSLCKISNARNLKMKSEEELCDIASYLLSQCGKCFLDSSKFSNGEEEMVEWSLKQENRILRFIPIFRKQHLGSLQQHPLLVTSNRDIDISSLFPPSPGILLIQSLPEMANLFLRQIGVENLSDVVQCEILSLQNDSFINEKKIKTKMLKDGLFDSSHPRLAVFSLIAWTATLAQRFLYQKTKFAFAKSKTSKKFEEISNFQKDDNNCQIQINIVQSTSVMIQYTAIGQRSIKKKVDAALGPVTTIFGATKSSETLGGKVLSTTLYVSSSSSSLCDPSSVCSELAPLFTSIFLKGQFNESLSFELEKFLQRASLRYKAGLQITTLLANEKIENLPINIKVWSSSVLDNGNLCIEWDSSSNSNMNVHEDVNIMKGKKRGVSENVHSSAIHFDERIVQKRRLNTSNDVYEEDTSKSTRTNVREEAKNEKDDIRAHCRSLLLSQGINFKACKMDQLFEGLVNQKQNEMYENRKSIISDSYIYDQGFSDEVGVRAEAFFYMSLLMGYSLPDCPALNETNEKGVKALRKSIKITPECWCSSTRVRFFPNTLFSNKNVSDALGYDFQLYDTRTGLKTMIEVKGTAAPVLKSFFLSSNEMRIAREQGESYIIVIVSNVMSLPRIERVIVNPMKSHKEGEEIHFTDHRIGHLSIKPSAFKVSIIE
eukprot:g5670.t1